MSNNYKNVLIVSNNAFSKVLNNGKTLESIFKDWPKPNIAQLFFSTNESPDISFCNNYFKITEIDILKSIISLNTFKPGRKISPNECHSDIHHSKKESPILIFLKKHAKTLAVIRDLLWSINSWKTKELKNWIEDFKPDLIFYVSGDIGFTHSIVWWIHKEYKIPYAVYFTDDYVINQYSENILQAFHQKTLLHKYKITIANASKCFVIGQLMAIDYSNRYNKEFIPLVNCIDFKILRNEKKPQVNNNFIFSYFGGLHLNRWKSIVQLGEFLKELQSELLIKCTFNIYSISEPNIAVLKLLNTPPLNYSGALDSDGVLRKIQESDVLVHVESLDTKYRLYTKYSISTKIPEYLSSQRCILGFGPSEVASIRILADNELGLVITDLDNKNEIKSKLKKLILSSEFRDSLSNNAYSYAKEHFDAQKMRSDLKANLLKMVKLKQ